MSHRICSYCQRPFRPDPRTAAIQKACHRTACQKTRKRQADRRWPQPNPDYDHSRCPGDAGGRGTIPTIGSVTVPCTRIMLSENRQQTRQRMGRLRRMFANQDAIRQDAVGYLQDLRQN
jgi:hypothetical protein